MATKKASNTFSPGPRKSTTFTGKKYKTRKKYRGQGKP